jgi:transposase
VKKFIRIGVDLAKNYFQVHALVSDVGPAVTRKLRRSKMHEFFSQIEPSLIGMEACGSAHYWARELKAMGHEVLLMPPAYTKPYVKRGKNDAREQGKRAYRYLTNKPRAFLESSHFLQAERKFSTAPNMRRRRPPFAPNFWPKWRRFRTAKARLEPRAGK